jgi:hypothetical protein
VPERLGRRPEAKALGGLQLAGAVVRQQVDQPQQGQGRQSGGRELY